MQALAAAYPTCYPCIMLHLLQQAAGQKMRQPRRRLVLPTPTLLAARGEYFALDRNHSNLAYQHLFWRFHSPVQSPVWRCPSNHHCRLNHTEQNGIVLYRSRSKTKKCWMTCMLRLGRTMKAMCNVRSKGSIGRNCKTRKDIVAKKTTVRSNSTGS